MLYTRQITKKHPSHQKLQLNSVIETMCCANIPIYTQNRRERGWDFDGTTNDCNLNILNVLITVVKQISPVEEQDLDEKYIIISA